MASLNSGSIEQYGSFNLLLSQFSREMDPIPTAGSPQDFVDPVAELSEDLGQLSITEAVSNTRTVLKKKAKSVKREICVLRAATKDSECPTSAKLLVGAAVIYAMSPIDLIPDFIPVLGILDDIVIVPGLLILAKKRIPKELIDKAILCVDSNQRLPKNTKSGKAVAVAVIVLQALMAYKTGKRFYPILKPMLKPVAARVLPILKPVASKVQPVLDPVVSRVRFAASKARSAASKVQSVLKAQLKPAVASKDQVDLKVSVKPAAASKGQSSLKSMLKPAAFLTPMFVSAASRLGMNKVNLKNSKIKQFFQKCTFKHNSSTDDKTK